MPSLKDKKVLITGSSRGIGLAIAKRFARDGACVAITGKTTEKHPKLPGTIFTAAKEVEELGGKALAIECDIRFEDQVEAMIKSVADTFHGLDILINNASAISLTPTEKTSMKRYDLMHQVNGRGTFLCSKMSLALLKESDNPHILNMSPPLNMNARWFGPHVAYTMSKYTMSMCTLGMSKELKEDGIAVNSLWPETGIATAAVKNLLGGETAIKKCRKPEIVADAAYLIVTKNAKDFTGNFVIDSELLNENGQADLSAYQVTPGESLMKDFFLD